MFNHSEVCYFSVLRICQIHLTFLSNTCPRPSHGNLESESLLGPENKHFENIGNFYA